MIHVAPVTLERKGIRLEALSQAHAAGLLAAASDGELWTIRVTSVPEPRDLPAYIAKALEMPDRCPFAVIDIASGKVIGSTSYHDILPGVKRVEIGYTWDAARCQRTHVNTTCKLMLLEHAFDTLGCAVVGLRTDILNHASQAAIERLGAHKDGVIRHHFARRDGTVRDTVMYSILRAEWPDIRTRLEDKLSRC